MSPSPRAALLAVPALLVVVGSYLMSNDAQMRLTGAPDVSSADAGNHTLVWPSTEDEDRMQRVTIKQQTIGDLLEGQLTFDEAAERFLEVSASTPQALSELRQFSVGQSDEERIVRQVVAFARSRATRSPEQYSDVLAQIEADADSRLASLMVAH